MKALTKPTQTNVAELFQRQLQDIPLDPNSKPAESGIDSLDLVTLLCTIDEEFGVRLSYEEFQQAETMNKLIEIIVKKG